MAEIWGTPRADILEGTDENDIIRGGRGEDTIGGGLGDDVLYGGWGNDLIRDQDGRSEIWGGRGGDHITFSRGIAYGGLGSDFIGVYGGGWAIGGRGNDTLEGGGALWGDQGPGPPPEQQVAGNDTLRILADPDSAWGHAGLGNDKFIVVLGSEEDPDLGIVDDFTPGEDKIQVLVVPGSEEDPFDLFRDLDKTRDGILNHDDTLAGGQVWVVEEANTIILGHGAARVVVHGATELAHSTDWLV